jgi:hypothetical protein
MDGKAVSLAETSMTGEQDFPDKTVINSVEINDIVEGFIKEVGNASDE